MPYHRPRPEDTFLTRRELLHRSGMGMGALALGSLLSETGLLGRLADAAETSPSIAGSSSISSVNPLRPKTPPLRPRAKRVVHLFMNGGPSHVDTFDPKPILARHHGKAVPANLPTERKTGAAFGSP